MNVLAFIQTTMTFGLLKITGSRQHWGVGCWVGSLVEWHGNYSVLRIFQQCGGIDCNPVSVEITYGLERLAMYIQSVNHVMDIVWQVSPKWDKRYCTRTCINNLKLSTLIIILAMQPLNVYLNYLMLMKMNPTIALPIMMAFPAFEYCLKCSHTFNLLDARGAISVTERMSYILRIRNLAFQCANLYVEKDAHA